MSRYSELLPADTLDTSILLSPRGSHYMQHASIYYRIDEFSKIVYKSLGPRIR